MLRPCCGFRRESIIVIKGETNQFPPTGTLPRAYMAEILGGAGKACK